VVADDMKPLYAQTADTLRSHIVLGAMSPGARLAPETELCHELGVSSITMRRAMATLVEEGFVVRVQGKGTFVSTEHTIKAGPPVLTSLTEDMRGRGWVPSAMVLAVETERGDGDAGKRLGLSARDAVTVISRLRFADGIPIGIQVASLPTAFFPGLDECDFSRESLYQVLDRRYAARPASAREAYRASIASDAEAKLLELKPQSPVLRSERLTFDDRGRRIEFVRSALRGDRYELALQLRAKRA
jgi:GntR family transcriptional regulator